MKCVLVRNLRGTFPVNLMCRTLGVVSSGFYAGMKRPESPQSRENRLGEGAIKFVPRNSRKTCGRPRIDAELNEAAHMEQF